MTRGRKPTENEQLATGLATIEDPYGLADLRTHSVEELLNAVRHEIRYAVVAMCRAGRLFMALKEKIPHGQWEMFLDSQHIPRSYARGCMKIVELVARYPKAVHLPPGETTNRLLNSSMAKIDAVLGGLPEAAIKLLTPWDLARVYDAEKLKEKGAQVLTRQPYPGGEPTALDKLYITALSTLRLIADLEIAPGEHAQAHAYADVLRLAWDHAHYNLLDPAHESVPPWELGRMDDISPEGLAIIEKGRTANGKTGNPHA